LCVSIHFGRSVVSRAAGPLHSRGSVFDIVSRLRRGNISRAAKPGSGTAQRAHRWIIIPRAPTQGSLRRARCRDRRPRRCCVKRADCAAGRAERLQPRRGGRAYSWATRAGAAKKPAAGLNAGPSSARLTTEVESVAPSEYLAYQAWNLNSPGAGVAASGGRLRVAEQYGKRAWPAGPRAPSAVRESAADRHKTGPAPRSAASSGRTGHLMQCRRQRRERQGKRASPRRPLWSPCRLDGSFRWRRP